MPSNILGSLHISTHHPESNLVNMVKSSRPPANGFVAAARHIYNPIGFGKGYNFILCKSCRVTDTHRQTYNSAGFLTIGYLFAFSLSRTS